jgi:hypothetical protein
MNDEGLLANGVSATKKEAKQLLDGIVSSMMEVRKMTGWNGVSATKMEQRRNNCWTELFQHDGGEKNDGVESIGKDDERLLVIGVSATGENERLLVFQQRKQ